VQSVKKQYSHDKSVRSSEDFKDKFDSLNIAAEISFSSEANIAGIAGGSMSLGAKASYDEVVSSTTSSKRFEQLEKIRETNFATGQLQVYRTVRRTVSFAGSTSTVKSVDYANSLPISEAKSEEDLRQWAQDYLKWHHPNPVGKITGSTYRETTCIKKACCNQLTITSNGAARDHQSWVLGYYTRGRNSNGRNSYKITNNPDRHLHFTPNSNWMVSLKKNIGNTAGFIYSKKCASHCPESCTLWTVWNKTAWEEDATLSVQCGGNCHTHSNHNVSNFVADIGLQRYKFNLSILLIIITCKN
jgi:hypothetical protein